MRQITAFKSANGRIFTEEKEAIAADEDMIGQELDELIHRVMCLDPGHSAMFKGVTSALKKKKELRNCIARILSVLDHCEEDFFSTRSTNR